MNVVGAGSMARPDRYARKWPIAAAVTLVSMMELVDTSVINVAIPQMSASIGASLDEITWVSIGYILAAVIVIPMSGWLSASFGRKAYFSGSILIFTFASLMCGLSGSLATLVFWRIVQGIGGGAFLSTTQAILYDSFPPEEKPIATALYGVGMMCGPAIGPTLGGFIVEDYTWPWIFLVNIPLGLLAFWTIRTYLRDLEPRRAAATDLPGLACMALGVGSLEFVLDRGQHYGWSESALICSLAAVSIAALALMIRRELLHPAPFLNLRVLKDPSLRNGCLFVVLLGMVVFGNLFLSPLYMQTILGYDAMTAGLISLPGAVASAVAMILAAKLGEKMDSRALLMLGALVLIYAMFLHSRFTVRMDPSNLIWPVILRGFGVGMMFLPLNTRALMNLEGRDLADGSALFNLLRQLGGSSGIALLTALLLRRTEQYRAAYLDRISAFDPNAFARLGNMTEGMIAMGTDPVTSQGRSVFYMEMTLRHQAAALAFNSVFEILAWSLVCSLPIILMLRQPLHPSAAVNAESAEEGILESRVAEHRSVSGKLR